MFKYEIIAKENEERSDYIYLNIGTSNGNVNNRLVKALRTVNAVMGIRVTNEEGEYLDYWYGSKKDIVDAVKYYGLPHYKGLIAYEYGFYDVILLKDGNFQLCDSHNLAISHIHVARNCTKKSFDSKSRTRQPSVKK